MDLDDLQARKPHEIDQYNLLFFGNPGSGKTTLAATAEDYEPMRDILYVDINAGVSSIQGRNVEVISPNEPEDLNDLMEWLSTHVHLSQQGEDLEEHNALIGVDEDVEFNTVVIDVLTSLQSDILDDLTGNNDSIINKQANQKSYSDWNANYSSIEGLIKFVKDLDVNSIFTAQAKEQKQDDGKETITVDLQSALTVAVPSMMDVCGYLYTNGDTEGEATRKLLLDQYEGIYAKNRIPHDIPLVLENPTVPKLMEKLEGEQT